MDTVWLRRLSTLAAASQVPAPTEAATKPAEASQTSCAVESGSEFETSTKGHQMKSGKYLEKIMLRKRAWQSTLSESPRY